MALPAAPQEPMLLLVSHPPVYALPLALGSVPGDHPSVVFAAAPLPAERGWGSADGGAASPEEQRECKLKKVSQNTQRDKTEAQRTAQREAERRKKQQQQRAAAAARNGNGPVASPLNAMAEILIGLSTGAIGTTSPITDSHAGRSMEREQAGD